MFVKVIGSDIPRCPNNNFDQSPEIDKDYIQNIYYGDQKSEESQEDEVCTGIIVSYEDSSKGIITSKDNGGDVWFWANHAKEGYRGILRPGDWVEFMLHRNPKGLQAREVKLAELKGVVSEVFRNNKGSFQYGYIQVDNGPEQLYFWWREVDQAAIKSLKPGTHVRFNIGKNDKGQIAFNVTAYST